MFVSKKCNNCGDWVDCKGVIKEEDDMVYCDACVEKKLKNVKNLYLKELGLEKRS